MKGIISKVKHGNSGVDYCLYDDGKKSSKKTIYRPKNVRKEFDYIDTTNKACFAALNLQRRKFPALTKMYFKIDTLSRDYAFRIEKKMQVRWLSMSKKAGFLPNYANIKKIVSSKQFILDLAQHKNNEIYVFLSTIRFIAAEPVLVHNVVTLVDTYGLDYFTAMLFASKLVLDNSNHHYLPENWCQGYLDITPISQIVIKPALIKAFKEFIQTMSTNKGAEGNFHGFTCNKTISSLIKYPVVKGYKIKYYINKGKK